MGAAAVDFWTVEAVFVVVVVTVDAGLIAKLDAVVVLTVDADEVVDSATVVELLAELEVEEALLAVLEVDETAATFAFATATDAAALLEEATAMLLEAVADDTNTDAEVAKCQVESKLGAPQICDELPLQVIAQAVEATLPALNAFPQKHSPEYSVPARV